MLHIILHITLPLFLAAIIFRQKWVVPYLIMLSTMLVDVDHLLADPIYDPGRCSIGNHLLHGFVPILIYAGLCLPRQTRLVGLGLMTHMALDSLDCQITNGVWFI